MLRLANSSGSDDDEEDLSSSSSGSENTLGNFDDEEFEMAQDFLNRLGVTDHEALRHVEKKAVVMLIRFLAWKYLDESDVRDAPMDVTWAVNLLGVMKKATDTEEVVVQDAATLSLEEVVNESDDDVLMKNYTTAQRHITLVALLARWHNIYNERVDEISETEVVSSILMRCQQVLCCARDIISCLWQGYSARINTGLIQISRYAAFQRFVPFVTDGDSDMKPHQVVANFLMEKIGQSGLLRCGESLMKQQRVRIENIEYGTRAYKKLCSIEEYIHMEITPSRQYSMHQLLWSGVTTPKLVLEMLVTNQDEQLQDYKPDRHLHAFKNGIYITKEHLFIHYNNQGLMPEQYVNKHCCSFKPNVFFDDALLIDECPDYEDWCNVSCPTFHSVLEYQFKDEADASAIMWFYALFVGKMLYEINEIDKWQIMPYLLGIAGTGKSTLLMCVASMFDASNVAILGNDMEKTFGLSILHEDNNVMLYMCLEVRSNFSLPQATFQSLVTGEPINMPKKHKDPSTTVIKAPGMFSGNVHMGYQDSSGSMARRLVTFSFKNIVHVTDTALPEKMNKELAAIMVKGNLAYRHLVSLYGTHDVWRVLPACVQKERRNLVASMNPISAFLDQQSIVRVQAGGYVSLTEFKLQIKRFMNMSQIRPVDNMYSRDNMNSTLLQYGCSVVAATKEWQGESIYQDYVLGIELLPNVECISAQSRSGRGFGGF